MAEPIRVYLGGGPAGTKRQEQISVDGVDDTQETFPIDMEEQAPPSSEETISDRSYKFKYGLEDVLQKSKDEIYKDLQAGNEGFLRQQAASQLDVRKTQETEKALKEITNRKGGPLDAEETKAVQDIIGNMTRQTDPKSVLEESYAKQFVSELDRRGQANPNNIYEDAKRINPAGMAKLSKDVETLIAKREYANTLLQDVRDELKNQGWAPFLADQAKFFVPGYQDVKLRGNTKNTGMLDTGFLGTNIEKQRNELLNLEFSEYKKQLDDIVAKMRNDNPTLTADYLEKIINVSTSGVILDGLTLPLDVVGLGVGKATVKGAKAAARSAGLLKDAEKAVKDMARGAADPALGKSTVLDAAGDVQEAAVVKATTNVIADMEGVPEATRRAVEQLSSTFRTDVQGMKAAPGRASQEVVNKFEESTNNIVRDMLSVIVNVQKVDRLPDVMATETAVRAIIDDMKDTYRDIRHSIFDVSAPYREKAANTWLADMYIGQPDGNYFRSRKQAELFATFHGLTDAKVEQQGLGYFLSVTKPINETSDVIRDLIATTANSQIPEITGGPLGQFVKSVIAPWRTPEETLSKAERANRLTVTTAPSEYFAIMRQNFDDLNKLRAGRFSGKSQKQRWDEFSRVVTAATAQKDEAGLPGKFFNNIDELEEFYLSTVKRLPDDIEIGAYFEFKRGMEIDRVFRNIAEVRNQRRLGAETHKVTTTDADGKLIASDEFSGITMKQWPRGADDNVLIMGEKKGDERIRDISAMSIKEADEFAQMVNDGTYKLIRIYNPELRPLNNFVDALGENNGRVRYVLAKTSEVRDLDWNQIKRRGGGHIDYDYQWFIKQAKMYYDNTGKRFWYEGDTTVMPVSIQKMGKDIIKHLNEVRLLLKNNDEGLAREYVNDNLHVDWDTVKRWFLGQADEEGNYRGAQLSLDEPLELVQKGRSIADMDDRLQRRYQNFKNSTKSGSDARLNQVQYSGERDAYDVITLNDIGTAGKPLYELGPAKIVDPLTTLNRGLNRIAKSNFMDDYKTMSVEHWLKQAQPYLIEDAAQLRSAPYYYFEEARFRPGVDPTIQRQLETAREHTKNLMGQPSWLDTQLHNTAQKLVDSIYGTFGPKAVVLEPSWMLQKIKDPLSFARSVAFNAKLGLFNVAQFAVQMGGYANIASIAGVKYATPGTLGAQLHFFTRANSRPQIVQYLDGIASKMNVPGASAWKPGEFKEAWEELGKTGWANVGKEYAALDDFQSNKIWKGTAEQLLDIGQVFFKGGEENVRLGSWYTAFKEFRDRVPVGKITEADRADILQRADLLNINMTRASSSGLHQGALSIPTQFLTYNLRLMELMTGKRLTGTEKARLFGTNAVMYGIPMATGLSGFPFADMIRQKAVENGYVDGDNYYLSLVMNGLPSALGAVISGNGESKNGVWLDIGPRFGTKGFEFLGSLTKSDKSWLDIMGGPAFSVIKNTGSGVIDLAKMAWSMTSNDPDAQFQITAENVFDVFKEFSSANSLRRVWAAANTGRWVSKNEAYLADTTVGQALLNAVTGLKDQRINDIQTLSNSMKDQAAREKEVEQRFTTEFRRGALAAKDGNWEEAQTHFKNGKAWLIVGGYREDRKRQLVSKAMQDNMSILDKLDLQFMQRAPQGQQETRMEQFRKTKQIQEMKAGK